MEPTAENQWYGVKCLFEHRGLAEEPGRRVYEERVIVVLASSFDEAIVRADAEAAEYIRARGEYLGFCDVYCTGSATLGDGSESTRSCARSASTDARSPTAATTMGRRRAASGRSLRAVPIPRWIRG
jgi:hypothetical protein